jgi:thioredoxin 1
MTTVIHLNQENFDAYFEKPLVAIEFWAPWCEPCHAFSRVYEEACLKYPQITFAKINVDEQVELAKDFTIRSVPTLVVLHNKTMIFHQAGLLPEHALVELLDQAVNIAKI